MPHFAQINEENIVTKVIYVSDAIEALGEQAFSQMRGGTWLHTSYTGRIRGKYAGIGDRYDPVSDTFVHVPSPDQQPEEEE